MSGASVNGPSGSGASGSGASGSGASGNGEGVEQREGGEALFTLVVLLCAATVSLMFALRWCGTNRISVSYAVCHAGRSQSAEFCATTRALRRPAPAPPPYRCPALPHPPLLPQRPPNPTRRPPSRYTPRAPQRTFPHGVEERADVAPVLAPQESMTSSTHGFARSAWRRRSRREPVCQCRAARCDRFGLIAQAERSARALSLEWPSLRVACAIIPPPSRATTVCAAFECFEHGYPRAPLQGRSAGCECRR